jgi:hypothetical protein
LVIIYICSSDFLTQSLNYALVAGKNVTEKSNHQMLTESTKAERTEIGEGSSPGTARQLEYAPRVEPVIKTTTKKYFSSLRPLVIQRQALDPRYAPTVGGSLQQN